MAEVLGLGVTHSPTFARPPAEMAMRLRQRLEDPNLPTALRGPAGWPQAAVAEWGADGGAAAGAEHHRLVAEDLRRVRAALDAFKPDVVLIWGDDQYENFREDIIPAFCVLAYQDMVLKPWEDSSPNGVARLRTNVWNEPIGAQYPVSIHREAAKYLTTRLLQSDVDVAYAYQPLHYPGLPHAFKNTVLFLDYDRAGFDYPILPFQVNCYGRRVISERGLTAPIGRQVEPDPPSPSPRRCFDVGSTVARICLESPWRVALVASSSWSHSFLVEKTYRMWPDVDFDRQLYAAMINADYDFWAERSLEEVEDAGGQETLNWFLLMGAMKQLGQVCTWSSLIETHIFNATKVSAIFGDLERR